MWIDERAELADAQTVGVGGGATASSDYYDVGGDFNIGPGETLYWVVSLDLIAGDELTFALQTDDNTSFSSATTIASIVFAENEAAGTKKYVGFPSGNERYIRHLMTPTADDASNTFSSWITKEHPSEIAALPDNVPA